MDPISPSNGQRNEPSKPGLLQGNWGVTIPIKQSKPRRHKWALSNKTNKQTKNPCTESHERIRGLVQGRSKGKMTEKCKQNAGLEIRLSGVSTHVL